MPRENRCSLPPSPSSRDRVGGLAPRIGLTIVEMLVAMSITLLIMAAVVTVFANVSGSVTRRRATIEMASALRNVRETLARDLAGATCPTVPWQRPESNQGYFELIEGPQNDYYPTPWLWDGDDSDSLPDPIGAVPGIDLSLSSIPGSDLGGDPANDVEGRGLVVGTNSPLPENVPTDGRGLGDADDTLMLTARNEKEPFVGRIPLRAGVTGTPSTARFPNWQFEEVTAPLAEVAWFAVENPVDPNRTFAFGEPGYRTIYRRALLIIPELDYQIDVTDGGIGSNPTVVEGKMAPVGVVRVLGPGIRRRGPVDVARALAALIAFQERYDLSVRLEWDPDLPSGDTDTPGRWVLRANTLGDLTKRENRFEHHGFVATPQRSWLLRGDAAATPDRFFPFAAATSGIHTNQPTLPVQFFFDPELNQGVIGATGFRAVTDRLGGDDSSVVAFERSGGTVGRYNARPLAFVQDAADYPATARAILNEDGGVAHVTAGLAPLGGARRGDDVMMTEALAFDVRVFDPGAPVYGLYPNGDATRPAQQVVQPGDPAWAVAYDNDSRFGTNSILKVADLDAAGNGTPGLSAANPYRYERQGAYVDLAYRLSAIQPRVNAATIPFRYQRTALDDLWDASAANGSRRSPYFFDGLIRVATGPNGVDASILSRRYATYDTWSWHYENNGVNEDGDRPDGALRAAANDPAATDEGANGLDDLTAYGAVLDRRLGPDDYAERETRPPYDASLRGVQVTLRAYERDSRQIREVRVRESFVPE